MSRLLPLVLFAAAALALRASAADQALRFDPAQSHVEVAVKATVDSFVAELQHYETAVSLHPDGSIHTARFTCQFRDLFTGKSKRDRAMHEWQQTEAHPEVVFELLELTPKVDTNVAAARGRLTFHGITRELSFPVSVARDGNCYGIDGDAVIDTRDFGLRVIRMLGLLSVDPRVHVRFHLQGAATGGEEVGL